MAVNAASGALALTVGTGNQSVTGLGFTPKLIILQSTPDTANIVTSVANSHWSMGAFDGVNAAMQASNIRNGTSTSDTARYTDTTNGIYVADPPGTMTPDYIAAPVSLDTDGFTINITNAPPINYRFGYFALGGSDITNVKVGTFSSKGSTGAQSIFGVGFQPDLIICFLSGTFGATPVSQGDMTKAIGWANSVVSLNQWAMSIYSQDAITDVLATTSAQGQGFVVYALLQKAFVSLQASLTSFDADGFSLNWSAHSPAVGINISYIAIKGTVDFHSAVGSFVTPASTGGTSMVTGLGFDPKCGLFASPMTTTVNTYSTGAHGCIGWADVNKNMFSVGNSSRFYAGFLNAWHTSHDQRINRYILYSNGTRLSEESLSSWNTGGFTVYENYNSGGVTTRMGYLVMNAVAITPPTPGGSDVFGYMV